MGNAKSVDLQPVAIPPETVTAALAPLASRIPAIIQELEALAGPIADLAEAEYPGARVIVGAIANAIHGDCGQALADVVSESSMVLAAGGNEVAWEWIQHRADHLSSLWYVLREVSDDPEWIGPFVAFDSSVKLADPQLYADLARVEDSKLKDISAEERKGLLERAVAVVSQLQTFHV